MRESLMASKLGKHSRLSMKKPAKSEPGGLTNQLMGALEDQRTVGTTKAKLFFTATSNLASRATLAQ